MGFLTGKQDNGVYRHSSFLLTAYQNLCLILHVFNLYLFVVVSLDIEKKGTESSVFKAMPLKIKFMFLHYHPLHGTIK